MVPRLLLAVLIHGLSLVGLSAAIGGLVLEQWIIPVELPDWSVARDRLGRWITAWLFVLMPATFGDVVIRAQAMSRAPLASAIVSLPAIMTHTHFGIILTARSAGLLIAVLLSLTRSVPLRVSCLLIALGLALTTSLTGHAADWGDVTFSTAVDWTHAVAASAWTGGVLGLAFVIFRGDTLRTPESLDILVRRFSRLAAICLLAVVLTGSYNAWAQLGAVSKLWSSPYGRLLFVKLLVVAALVWLGAINRYVLIPRLSAGRIARGAGARLFRILRLVVLGTRGRKRSAPPPSQLSRYVAWEALFALGVFACTAALGEAMPGRQSIFERKPMTHVAPLAPRSSASVPRVGTVTVPPGQVSRGRAVFLKLRCFTCHAVRGEQVPSPSRPGPDLTDAGRFHPGYLMEAIINPNAMILDGPGYTDDRGLSIMPDYRNKLTVSELIDLIAYLKSR